jgi:hypothetical protein
MSYSRTGWTVAILLALCGSLAPGMQRECRSEASTTYLDTTTSVPDRGLERELLMLTNQDRGRQGLQALSLDEALTRIAREHAAGMARQGFISHVLPYGNLKTRMTSRGYRYQTARENVATAGSVFYAQTALMDSPAHKDNILASDVDRVGIGIVRCPPPFEKRLFITEIFATPSEEHQPAEVEETLLNRVEDLRKNGAGSMLPDPLLERLASESVGSLNVPVQREELRNLLASSAGELQKNGRSEIARVDVSVQLVRDPKNVSILNQPHLGQEASKFGSAIRQVVDNQNEPAFLVLTLIGFTN